MKTFPEREGKLRRNFVFGEPAQSPLRCVAADSKAELFVRHQPCRKSDEIKYLSYRKPKRKLAAIFDPDLMSQISSRSSRFMCRHVASVRRPEGPLPFCSFDTYRYVAARRHI